MSIDQIQELKSIIMGFRVTELTQLLAFCNQSRFGRKSVLQERALDLLKKDNLTQKVQFKIRELYFAQGNHHPLQKSTSEIPHNQDSSSNECTITESDMSHAMNFNPTTTKKSHVSEYYSMPKFDLGLGLGIGRADSTKINSYHGSTNVQFKPIPFDDVVFTLIESTLLMPSPNKARSLNSYDCNFKLTAEQANEISITRAFNSKSNKFEFNSQIHLRFCQVDHYLSQDDLHPNNLTIRLNSRSIPLPTLVMNNKPGMESKRPCPKPIDLTPHCKLSPVASNFLNISWTQDSSQKNFFFIIYLARKLTSKDLLDKLKSKGVTDPMVTQKMIISKLTDTDNEISTTSLKGNLNCPLGKMRIRLPARSTQCNHIQCFDAELYLQMNEKKPNWLCPVCDKKAEYKTLFIDGFFTQILNEASADSNEIEFTEDGGWRKVMQSLNKSITLTPQRRKIEEVESSSIKKSKKKPEEEEEIIELSSDSEDDNNENVQTQPSSLNKLSYYDVNTNKSLNSASSYSPFNISLSSLCSQLPLDANRNHSRNLITRYFQKADKFKPNSSQNKTNSTHSSHSFGDFSFPIGSSTTVNENSSNLLRGCSSEVISID